MGSGFRIRSEDWTRNVSGTHALLEPLFDDNPVCEPSTVLLNDPAERAAFFARVVASMNGTAPTHAEVEQRLLVLLQQMEKAEPPRGKRAPVMVAPPEESATPAFPV